MVFGERSNRRDRKMITRILGSLLIGAGIAFSTIAVREGVWESMPFLAIGIIVIWIGICFVVMHRQIIEMDDDESI